jgi:glycosyltransferase involved in cell wall biosynthesis
LDQSLTISNQHFYRDRRLVLLAYFLFYYAFLLGFYLENRLLSQYHPIFFNYNRDLTELALIATGIPRWMIAHPFSFTVADAFAFLLPLPILVNFGRKHRLFAIFEVIFAFFIAFYLLLADIFWQVHPEPFILFFLLALAFTTNRPDRFDLLMTGCRYYFLYIFASAAIWKVARGTVFNGEQMSRILLVHHADLLTGTCTSLSCRFYSWLIAHPPLSQTLYIASALLEASFILGFFTRRFDRWLIVLAIVFVMADLLVMRIPYWTVLLGTLTLWLRPAASSRKDPSSSTRKEKKIVLYETTHHENLPALLDLCEVQFNQVAVFLKEISYHNLTGEGSPEQRWPQTDFFIQTTDCPNRRFIRQLLRFVRRHSFTHLHLCTLDNNLLLFAIRLPFIGPVHLSLTVHEVNEYFSRSFHTVRDWTETIAKKVLHLQIRHYHVFLPAMADQLCGRLSGSTVVFIPSRFYSGHRPPSHPSPTHTSPFRIIVPGSLDPNRRHYDDIIKALPILSSISSFEFVLLGDATSETATPILADFQPLLSDRIGLRTFNGYIPQATYEQTLTQAHLVWSPLNICKSNSRNHPETYGLTTASGLTADLLVTNIPVLVPADFIVPEPFRPALCSYGSPEEACKLIRGFLDDPAAYAAIRMTIHQAFTYFSKENFAGAFRQLTGAFAQSARE